MPQQNGQRFNSSLIFHPPIPAAHSAGLPHITRRAYLAPATGYIIFVTQRLHSRRTATEWTTFQFFTHHSPSGSTTLLLRPLSWSIHSSVRNSRTVHNIFRCRLHALFRAGRILGTSSASYSSACSTARARPRSKVYAPRIRNISLALESLHLSARRAFPHRMDTPSLRRSFSLPPCLVQAETLHVRITGHRN